MNWAPTCSAHGPRLADRIVERGPNGREGASDPEERHTTADRGCQDGEGGRAGEHDREELTNEAKQCHYAARAKAGRCERT